MSQPVYQGVAHPWLCDVMGHMTTRHYVAMFDDASYHFLYKVFGWTPEQAKKEQLGWADVKHEINYQAEVANGDLLQIFAEFKRLGGKSVVIRYRMYNLTRDEKAATLDSTSVLFDMAARKAVALTDIMRQQATAFLVEDSL